MDNKLHLSFPDSPGVYKIENTVSGKKYIGCTQSIRKRVYIFRRLFLVKTGLPRKMLSDLAQHGRDSFKFSVLELCKDLKKLNKIEQKWIDKLINYDDYNHKMKSDRTYKEVK